MSIVNLAKQLEKQGHRVEIREGKLYVDGRFVPVVTEGDAPYQSDCPNGRCNI